MQMIERTSQQFVRCIKPNSTACKSEFNCAQVLSQLKCSGVVEALHVARKGYPHKITQRDFMARFGCLLGSSPSASAAVTDKSVGTNLSAAQQPSQHDDDVMICQSIIKVARVDTPTTTTTTATNDQSEGGIPNHNPNHNPQFVKPLVAVGKTKVFLTHTAYAQLETCLQSKLEASAVSIQRLFRGFLARKWVARHLASTRLQCWTRMCVAVAAYKTTRTKTLLLQSCARTWASVLKYRHTRARVVQIQCAVRCRLAAKERKRIISARKVARAHAAATALQAWLRLQVRRQAYSAVRRCCVRVQSFWRAIQATALVKEMLVTARHEASLHGQLEVLRAELAFKDEETTRLARELTQEQQAREAETVKHQQLIDALKLANEKEVIALKREILCWRDRLGACPTDKDSVDVDVHVQTREGLGDGVGFEECHAARTDDDDEVMSLSGRSSNQGGGGAEVERPHTMQSSSSLSLSSHSSSSSSVASGLSNNDVVDEEPCRTSIGEPESDSSSLRVRCESEPLADNHFNLPTTTASSMAEEVFLGRRELRLRACTVEEGGGNSKTGEDFFAQFGVETFAGEYILYFTFGLIGMMFCCIYIIVCLCACVSVCLCVCVRVSVWFSSTMYDKRCNVCVPL
jgi:hypothetical protein